jgi:hypothetical protein
MVASPGQVGWASCACRVSLVPWGSQPPSRAFGVRLCDSAGKGFLLASCHLNEIMDLRVPQLREAAAIHRKTLLRNDGVGRSEGRMRILQMPDASLPFALGSDRCQRQALHYFTR